MRLDYRRERQRWSVGEREKGDVRERGKGGVREREKGGLREIEIMQCRGLADDTAV